MEWCADQRPFCGAARVRVSLFALLLTAIGCADATDDAAEASSLNVPSLPSQNDFGVAERIDGRVESADAAAVADAMSVRPDAEMQIDSGIENCAPSGAPLWSTMCKYGYRCRELRCVWDYMYRAQWQPALHRWSLRDRHLYAAL